jgi:TrkA-N domain/RyR domain
LRSIQQTPLDAHGQALPPELGVLDNRRVEAAEPSSERPRRRGVEWAVVGALALVALVLGYIGFAQVYADEDYRPGELLYRSLQLFVLESGAVNDATAPLSLEIARVLAPAVAAYAAIRGIVILFGEQLALVGLRFRLHDHVVIAGLGRKGFALAKALREAGERVVVIERNAAHPAIVGCRERKIPVLVGDAADQRLLLRTNLGKARALVVVTDDDRTNIDVAFAVAALRLNPATRLLVYVHLDDLVLWRLLQPRLLTLRKRLPFRLEFFNLDQEAARVLLGEQTAGPHLLVVGPSGLAESLVVGAARRWRAAPEDDGRLRITVAGTDAPAQRESLVRRYPGLEDACEVAAWELELGSPERPPTPVATTFVCLDGESSALAAALVLATYQETSDVPTVMAVEDERVGVASALRESLPQLRLFGVLRNTMTADLLVHGMNEVLAEAKHEHYVRLEREHGATVDENPSLVPWHELDESLKESNRLFADGVAEKLESTGCTVVPAPLADPKAPGFAFTEQEVEELARAEHERWCRDLEREGWRYGDVKDPAGKLHPSLVPWSELPESERDKDRDPVRALPELLALVGFEIRREAPVGEADQGSGSGGTGRFPQLG